jgi:hypothetical protein
MSKQKRGAAPGVHGDAFDSDFETAATFAEGTELPRSATREIVPAASYFRVTINYREPEYEARRGKRAQPFRWTYRIAASDADRAAAAGVDEFQATARASSVSWRRDIVSVVAVADEPDPS